MNGRTGQSGPPVANLVVRESNPDGAGVQAEIAKETIPNSNSVTKECVWVRHKSLCVNFNNTFMLLIFNICFLGSWADWQPWSPCSYTCGRGLQKRTRLCPDNNCDGDSIQSRQCNRQHC